MKTEQAAQRVGSSLLFMMPLRVCGCWTPAVRVVGLLLVGGAAAIFLNQTPHSAQGRQGTSSALDTNGSRYVHFVV